MRVIHILQHVLYVSDVVRSVSEKCTETLPDLQCRGQCCFFLGGVYYYQTLPRTCARYTHISCSSRKVALLQGRKLFFPVVCFQFKQTEMASFLLFLMFLLLLQLFVVFPCFCMACTIFSPGIYICKNYLLECQGFNFLTEILKTIF